MTCPVRWAWNALRVSASLATVAGVLARDRIEVLVACAPTGWPR